MKMNYVKIMNHTKYICSAFEKTIHSTINPCEEAYMIEPDIRWYIDEIPTFAEFKKCRTCFPKSDYNNEDSGRL